MKITYALEFLPERRRTKEGEDLLALKAFLAGKYENMCIQYEDEAFRTGHQQHDVFDLYRRENCVYILRQKKDSRRKAS